jgi:hypothetical protein
LIDHRAVLLAKVRSLFKKKSPRFEQAPLRFAPIHAIFVKLDRDPVKVCLKFFGIGNGFKRSDHRQSRVRIGRHNNLS